MLLAREGRVLARFWVGESVRKEAAEAVASLRAQGIRVLMLTGDNEKGARLVADRLGIESESRLSPADKVERLAALGKGVAMVGDGLNDAPALAGTGPSFAMGEGSDLSRGLSQVTLLKSDLRLVPWTIALARRALAIGRRNLIWATLYNIVFLGLAVAGALRPVWAGLSMLGSSLLALFVSLRVASFEGPPGKTENKEAQPT
jgi:P-type E1-E2 ATPase